MTKPGTSETVLVEALELLRETDNIGWPTEPAESSRIRQRIRDFLERASQPLPLEGEWVTVPREPTETMIDAGIPHAHYNGHIVQSTYTAMLAAAPPPHDGRGEVEREMLLAHAGRLEGLIAEETARAETAEAQLAEAKGEIEREDKAHGETIDQRDAAEQALSQAYYLVIGRSPEWSNVFGHADALEEIDEAQQAFRTALKATEAQRDRLLEAGKPFKQMAEVLEARALMTFGRTVPDIERLLLSSGEVGTAAINMGHFRALKAAHGACHD